ncbi:MAG TPA: ABC transporter substrate-binding protein [Propionibacteriaceae bacterium]|nr:ABC transporter substrate-binding protein [Propionibacteriaceae bacterium]
MTHPTLRRALVVGAAFLLVAGCAQTKEDSNDAAAGLTVGTTDKVTSIDPAGSYDNGSFFVMNQVYPFLLNSKPGAADTTPESDIAESASFTTPTEYTVKLKSGLKFVNGHDLTSSDVKFSFDRMVAIKDPNGPASLLYNLVSTAAPDATTIVFTLKNANDQIWPQILTSPAGPIVDEETFPADAKMADDAIVAAHPFAGPYDITSYSLNTLVSYKAFDGYQGLLGKPATAGVNVKYYADANNMKLDVEQGNIDVALRSLSATDIESLAKNDKVTVHEGPGGEIRYLVFNMDVMPFGAKTAEKDAAKAKAVRQAIANLIDRDAISTSVFKSTYSPLYSVVPDGQVSAGTQLKTLYGDGNGKPSLDKAKAVLEAAGVTTPVTLKLQYNPDHYGPSSGDEYAALKTQIENGGLFTVDLQSTEWVQYSKQRSADAYGIYQLGWFPDYSDPDNYLAPFFTKDNFLVNHYDNAEVQSLISAEATEGDAAKRLEILTKIQDIVADELPTLPMQQGKQLAVAGKDVKGVSETLDASFKVRLGTISK